MVGGAVVGAVAALGVLGTADRFGGALPLRDAATLTGIGAVAGAAIGALLGPLAGFGLLRRVPLGQAMRATGLGALAGLGLGLVAGFNAVLLSVAGFALGALYARRVHVALPAPEVRAAAVPSPVGALPSAPRTGKVSDAAAT